MKNLFSLIISIQNIYVIRYFFILLFMVFVLAPFFSCSESECTDCNNFPCNLKAKTVKEASNQIGFVAYSEHESKWLIIVSQTGTYDSQDLGIVCNDLPENFQQIGMKVLFSGEYKEYDKDPNGPLPGQTYYYLFISNISKPNDE